VPRYIISTMSQTPENDYTFRDDFVEDSGRPATLPRTNANFSLSIELHEGHHEGNAQALRNNANLYREFRAHLRRGPLLTLITMANDENNETLNCEALAFKENFILFTVKGTENIIRGVLDDIVSECELFRLVILHSGSVYYRINHYSEINLDTIEPEEPMLPVALNFDDN